MSQADRSQPVPVAIIGMGCLFPMADDLARFWSNIRDRVDAITEVPPTHWRPEDYFDDDPKAPDRTYARRGGFLTPVDFPLLDFGIAPNTIEATDTTQLLGLLVARQALLDAGYGPDRNFERDRVSVVLGVTGTLELVIPLGARLGHPIWRRALKQAGVDDQTSEDVVRRIADSYVGWQENSFPGLLGNVAAGRIANRLDLGGTNCVVDAACASSLGAINVSILELAAGRCDVALSGGLDTFNDIFMYMCFSKTPALSPTGDARPFDAASDGTILGEGLGIVVLKRLADAQRDGDRIYAVIRSIGTSSDGKGQAVYAPSAAGQVRALRHAYDDAGVSPASIELVEAHGTGTKVGDATELEALEEVYRAAGPESPWCALGSVKSQLGHTKAAAGAAGLIKAALALHHKVLPPTIKVSQPIGSMAAGNSPFYLNTECRPWLPRPDHPRRAAVSAFGFGGSNYHCLLEEASPAMPGIDWGGHVQILAYSADDPAEIVRSLPRWNGDTPWAAIRTEAALSRARFRTEHCHRLLLVARRAAVEPGRLMDRARARLAELPAAGEKRSETFAQGGAQEILVGSAPPPGKLAMLFPGQGSQYLGMFRDLACRFPRMLDALALWNELSGDAMGMLSDRIYPIPAFREEDRRRQERALRDTRVAQPAIGAVSLGLLRILDDLGVRPDLVGGHSFGELTALCAAGKIDERALAFLSIRRGALMAASAGEDSGTMLAVLAPIDDVARFVHQHKLDLVLANKNAPRQCVLSGPRGEIERAADLLAAQQVATRPLAVSAAFHSRFVAGAEASFHQSLAGIDFHPGQIPTFSNVTGKPYPEHADEAREVLAGQLSRPVEFVSQVEAMHRMGARVFLEVGPDAKLTGLVRAILDGSDHQAIAVDQGRSERGDLAGLALALANLAALGYPLKLTRWDEGYIPPAVGSGRTSLSVKVCGAHPSPIARTGAGTTASSPFLNGSTAPSTHQPTTPGQTADTPAARKTAGNGKLDERANSERIMSLPEQNQARSTNGHSSLNRSRESRAHGRGRDRIEDRQTSFASTRNASSPPVGEPLLEAIRQTQESLIALQRLAEQTAQLHRQFLEGQETAHRTIQSLLEQQQHLTTVKSEEASFQLPSADAPRIVTRTSTPDPQVPPRTAPLEHLPPSTPVQLGNGTANGPPPETFASAPITKEIGLAARTASASPIESRRGPDARIAGLLLEVVVEKTGYPTDMLDLGMSLDADLGIDSIKRVEILSALQDRLPGSPAVGPEQLGTLRTLADIVRFLNAAGAPVPPQADAGGDVAPILLEVVAEKTGYPTDMLNLDMLLDADLGIDSIKRVEILSALQDRLPGSPAVGPEQLGTLRTLADIVRFLEAGETLSKPDSPATTSPEPLDRSAAVAAPAKSIARLNRLHARPVPFSINEDRPTRRLANGSEVWLINDGSPLTELIVAGLRAHGLRVQVLGLDDSIPETDSIAGLVILDPSGRHGDDLIKQAFRWIKAAGPRLRQIGRSGGAVLATVSRLDGRFGSSGLTSQVDPTAGALAGLAKTAAAEWPEVNCKAIDVDPGLPPTEALASSIVEELYRQGPLEVALNPDGPHILQLVPADPLSPRDGSSIVAAGDLVVVTGGARGVTAAVALELARSARPRLILLGRTPRPADEPSWLSPHSDEAFIRRALLEQLGKSTSPQVVNDRLRLILAQREIRQSLERIRLARSEVAYHEVDVREAASVAAVIREIQARYGPIRGLVHGAGVLADRRIEDQTEAQFATVYDTKVAGLRNLLSEMDLEGLKFVALFSSSTARFGRAGQVAYAAGNEALNKWAQQLSVRLPLCRVVSFNWGPWDGGMVTGSLKPMFEKEGLGLIPLEEGARLLVNEIQAGPGTPVELVVLAEPVGTTPSDFPSTQKTSTPTTSIGNLETVFQRKVDLESLPVIRSHVIDGNAVLPMAIILEWLAEGALHRHPGMVALGVDNLRLLKGVVLKNHRALTVTIRVGKAERQGALQAVPVEMVGSLEGSREVAHARAEVILADRYAAPERKPAELRLPSLPWDRKEIYGGVLFHGPEMQGIQQVEGCDDRAIAAWVSTSPPPGSWIARPLRQSWLTDPLAIDAAFQIVILWCQEWLGANSLPTAVGSYRQFRRHYPAEGVRVLATIRQCTDHRALADIEFLDAAGVPVARIESYECVVDASLSQAFRRNRLTHFEVAPS